jgi:hypothetical protein
VFKRQTHSADIAVGPKDEKFFRLPPMSAGGVSVKAFRLPPDEGVGGPPGKVLDEGVGGVEEEPQPPPPEQAARELELELLHSNHLFVKGAASVSAQSL